MANITGNINKRLVILQDIYIYTKLVINTQNRIELVVLN